MKMLKIFKSSLENDLIEVWRWFHDNVKSNTIWILLTIELLTRWIIFTSVLYVFCFN